MIVKTSACGSGRRASPRLFCAIALAAGLTVAGASSAQDKELVVGWSGGVSTLDHHKSLSQTDHLQLENVYDSLTRRQSDGSAAPSIAESWKFAPDGLSVQIKVREGVRFHNGQILTADDVAYSILRLSSPDNPVRDTADQYSYITGAKAIDVHSLEVTFSRPDPLFLHSAAGLVSIVPRALSEDHGFDGFGKGPETAIGTGPYRVVDWVRDEYVVLEAFEDHWRGPAPIKKLTLRGIPNGQARVAALLAGEVDIIQNLAVEQIDVVNRHDGTEARPVPSVGRAIIMFNAHARPDTPLADIRIREAMTLAIDLQSIIDNVLKGFGDQVPVHTVPIEVGYNDKLKPHPFDPDRARALLAEAGYPDGIDGLIFLTRTRESWSEQVGQAVQAMWAKVGIKADLKILADDDFARQHELGNVDVSIWVHRGSATFHPQSGLTQLWACENGGANWSKLYCDREVQKLLIEQAPAAELRNPEEALDIYRDVQRHLYEGFATGGAWSLPFIYGLNSDLEWQPQPTGDIWLHSASWKQ